MSSKEIPIANLYYLLCYAWRHFEESDIVRMDDLEGMNKLCDLLGKVLTEGTFRLIRRGIDCGYRDFHENIQGVRGKINLGETVKQALRAKGQVACNFEEMSSDVLHNQILRSTLKSLMRASELNKDIKSAVRNAFDRLSGIKCIPLRRQHFQSITLDRNRRYYRFLLSVCKLIHEQLLVDEHSGDTQFTKISDTKMEKLYEDFVIEFYRSEQSCYRVNSSSRTIYWDDEGTSDTFRSYIPRMEADVILESQDRRIIMDAKYYSQALSDYRGGKKINAGNLYQLLAYLRNREATVPSGSKHEGFLLYPMVDEPIKVDVCLEGFLIRARSIDLNQDWQKIHSDMLDLIE